MTEQTIPSGKLFREHPWHFRAWVNEQVELAGGEAVELFHYPARHQRVNLRLSNVCETGAHQYCQGANLTNPVLGADWSCHCLCHWASAVEREAYWAER